MICFCQIPDSIRNLAAKFWTRSGIWLLNSGLSPEFGLKLGKYDIKGLVAFSEDYKPRHCIVVSLDPYKRKISLENGTDILVLPWEEFLQKLWDKAFI